MIHGPEVVTSGLVFYFDAANPKSYSGSGSTAYDISGNGAVGALTNVTYSNGYMTFNGGAAGTVNSYINFGNPSALALSSEITIIAWTYPITTTGLGNIVSKNYNDGYRLRHDQTNNLWFYGSNQVFTPNASISLNVWQHSAITGNAAGLTAYINTISLASTASPFNPVAPGTGNFYVGCVQPGQETFNGRISMVQIYNRALTQLEIQKNYFASKSRYGI
jgi:hypothetical protein